MIKMNIFTNVRRRMPSGKLDNAPEPEKHNPYPRYNL